MAARQDHKLVEVTQQLLRASALVDNTLTLGLLDSPLDAIFVKSLEHVFDSGPQADESQRSSSARAGGCDKDPRIASCSFSLLTSVSE
jgi:hypothetical protein